MFTPHKYNITIYQGSDYIQAFVITEGEAKNPVDFTGWTARMQIRTRVNSEDFWVNLTTENGGISIVGDGSVGSKSVITVNISSAQTDAMTRESGVYDMELISPTGKVIRYFEGDVTLVKGVTRDVV